MVVLCSLSVGVVSSRSASCSQHILSLFARIEADVPAEIRREGVRYAIERCYADTQTSGVRVPCRRISHFARYQLQGGLVLVAFYSQSVPFLFSGRGRASNVLTYLT